jgi:hypothetical protein
MSTHPAESYRVALNKVAKLTQALAGPDASTTYAAALAELSEALAALDNPAPPQSEEADEAALPDLRASRDEARKVGRVQPVGRPSCPLPTHPRDRQ